MLRVVIDTLTSMLVSIPLHPAGSLQGKAFAGDVGLDKFLSDGTGLKRSGYKLQPRQGQGR